MKPTHFHEEHLNNGLFPEKQQPEVVKRDIRFARQLRIASKVKVRLAYFYLISFIKHSH